MKKIIGIAALAAILLMGCTSLNRPVLLSDDGDVGSKTGQASGSIYAGIWGDADAGMITAARNGGITKIGAVDFRVTQFGSYITTYTTTVTGE